MQAVILAAGMGKRLGFLGKLLPKILLPFDRWSLMDIMLLALHKSGVNKVIVVTGYKHEMIAHHAFHAKYRGLFDLEFLRNEKFATTNNAYSLRIALQNSSFSEGPFIVLDGDMVFDPKLLSMVVSSSSVSSTVCDVLRAPTEEDAKVVVKEDRVVAVGKGYNSSFVYTSIIKLGGDLLKEFMIQLDDDRYADTWYSVPLTDLLCTSEDHLCFLESRGHLRQEIDTLDDFKAAKELFRQLQESGSLSMEGWA